MTDAEAAAVLRRILHDRPGLVTREQAAIERAIEALGEIENLKAERDAWRSEANSYATELWNQR